jgi:GDP-mannose 6-dehydrogenase
LATEGHTVIGLDVNAAKLKLVADGLSPVIEEGMPELMQAAVQSGRVTVTSDIRAALYGSDVSFIAVGTPSAPNGSLNQEAVLSLTRSLGDALAEKAGYHLFVYRCTLAPGTTENELRPLLEKLSGRTAGVDFDICFQPEFLREGSSIRDYRNPAFTVVGADSARAVQVLRGLFGRLPAEFHVTSIRTAEMLKVCCNDFHAVKITFANEVARLCEAWGCDPFEVMDLVCQDRLLNVSPAYLKPGFAFGGSCLHKDLRCTLHLAKTRDVELPMLASVLPSNRIHIQKVIDKVLGSGKRRVGMIGLSFKSGTDDLRESALVVLAEELIGRGMWLAVYDPEVQLARLVGANREYAEHEIPHLDSLLCGDCSKVVREAEVIILGRANPDLIACLRAHARPEQLLIDVVGLRDRAGLPCAYSGISW